MTNITTALISVQEQISVDDDVSLATQRAHILESQYEEEQLPRGFYFANDSLMYLPEAKNENDQPLPIFICTKLKVTAYTRDDLNNNHGLLLEFRDVDNCLHEWAMPAELLAGDGTPYRQVLLAMGLRIAPGAIARNLLTFFIQSSKTRLRARCVACTGWYKSSFVLPDRIIGTEGKERVILQAASTNFPDYSCGGTLPEWRQNVSALCIGNSRLLFSVSVAFASPLLELIGLENGGFHFRGSSSTGKTSALFVAASVWGGKDYVQRWRGTINGIEAIAAGHNDTLLCLDELSQVDPEKAGEIAYLLANGSGKVRADRHGFSKKKLKWRLLLLSSGELSLAAHMNEVGKRTRGGQEVRLLDVPADTNKYGVFENLHGYPDGDVFSKAITKSCHSYFGTAAPEFLKRLVDQQDTAVKLLEKFSDEFLTAFVPVGADGQVRRVAKRFALVAAAGELATCFDITGWSPGDALAAARSCFLDWLCSRGGIGSQEEHEILSSVRRFFEQNGESQFTPWDAPQEHKTIKRTGFRKLDGGEVEFFVFPETFKSEIAKGFDAKLVAKICLKHGLLREGSKGEFTRSEQLPGMNKKTRCYRFTSKVLGDEE